MKERIKKLERKYLLPKKEAHIFIEVKKNIFEDATGNRCTKEEAEKAKSPNHDYIFVVKADTKRD